MKTGIICLIVIVTFFFISSCKQNFNKESGECKNKFEQVLKHYEFDPQKQLAARFLIENMDVHYSYESSYHDSFLSDIDSLYRNYPDEHSNFYREAYGILSKKYKATKSVCRKSLDIENITADFLIRHIDNVFQMWQSNWKEMYGFEHFCNYVLPYRIGNEPISDWLSLYISEYGEKIEMYSNCQQNKFYMFGLANALNRIHPISIYNPTEYMPELPLSLLPSVKIGDCNTYALRSVAQFRALGFPVAYDFVPQWGNRSMGHAWAVFLPTENLFFPFASNEPIGEHLLRRSEDRIPKIFRKTFRKEMELFNRVGKSEIRPELFQSPCIQDVTRLYIETSDITIPLFPNVKEGAVYLAVFNNYNWEIVHCGKRSGNKVFFDNMGREIVYLPVMYDEWGDLIPVAFPFILQSDGSMHVLQAKTEKMESVKLTRKYRTSSLLKRYREGMEGGKFQVARKKDFSDSITIATIRNVDENCFHELKTDNNESYRYFRYLAPPESEENMAELELYDGNNAQILVKDAFDNQSIGFNVIVGNNAYSLFDGNVLTNYVVVDKKKDIWVAVEFDKPVNITKIRFLPRNDDNFIREGEVYQLYYWDGYDWSLIEEKIGNREGMLTINNVPTNALLLLHNATCGKEERIFTYKDGKQQWW